VHSWPIFAFFPILDDFNSARGNNALYAIAEKPRKPTKNAPKTGHQSLSSGGGYVFAVSEELINFPGRSSYP